MANAAGMIYESIWRDGDWRKLSPNAQRLYMQLLSQKELDCAGILPLQVEKWAKGCDTLTVQQVWDDLDELQDARFVLYDVDTYEALIRTHVRNSNVVKIPNMRKSARRAALLVGSAFLRDALANELMASEHPDFIALAIEINPSLTVPEGFANRSKPEGLAKGSVTVTEPTGVGLGMGTGTHLGKYSSGEGRTPICAKHPNGNPNAEPCQGCKQAREQSEKLAVQSELQSKQRLRELRENCPRCHGTNTIAVGDNDAIKCDHTAVSHA